MPPVRRHNEQLQLVAVSGAAGSVRRTEPQWQEPCSNGGGCSSFTRMRRWTRAGESEHLRPGWNPVLERTKSHAWHLNQAEPRNGLGSNELLADYWNVCPACLSQPAGWLPVGSWCVQCTTPPLSFQAYSPLYSTVSPSRSGDTLGATSML